MAFIGVRISWLMLARKSLFAWLAASAAFLAFSSSMLFSSISVMSSTLTSTPPALPSPPSTGAQLIWKVRKRASESSMCRVWLTCASPSLRARVQGS